MDNKPKRGRKPKKKNLENNTNNSETNNPIIVHLPIQFKEDNESSNDIFIKHDYNEPKKIKELENKVKKLEMELKKQNNLNHGVENVELKNDSSYKCWWCRYHFSSPKVELPEKYFNDIFYCYGNFCSYNCAMAYNISLNDENIFKRNSLLHFHYKKTYGEFKKIIPSASWKVLAEAGGCINIKDYRQNFLTNKLEFNYIKPPMISHIAQVEKISKIKKPVVKNDLVLKRSKPLKTSKYSLESTMGLKIISSDTN